MISFNLASILIQGVAVISGLAGLTFGVAGTVSYMNKKSNRTDSQGRNHSRLNHQALLASSSQTIRG